MFGLGVYIEGLDLQYWVCFWLRVWGVGFLIVSEVQMNDSGIWERKWLCVWEQRLMVSSVVRLCRRTAGSRANFLKIPPATFRFLVCHS